MSRIGVIGAGSWGTALATVLAGKGHDVTIWLRNKEQAEELQKDRENKKYPAAGLFDSLSALSHIFNKYLLNEGE